MFKPGGQKSSSQPVNKSGTRPLMKPMEELTQLCIYLCYRLIKVAFALDNCYYWELIEQIYIFFIIYTHILITEESWPLLGAPSATWWATNRTAGWKCLVPKRANSQAVELSALLSSGSLTSGLNTPVPRLSLSSKACTFVWDWGQTSSVVRKLKSVGQLVERFFLKVSIQEGSALVQEWPRYCNREMN